jgi:DNA-binding LacI/PurR family transcriptional regulator
MIGVAQATVNSALEELVEEGTVRRRRGSGIFVSDQIHTKNVGLVFGGNIFDSGQSPFYSMLLDRSRHRSTSHDESFSFYLDLPVADRSLPVHQDLVEALQRRRLHGILLVSRNSMEQEAWLRAQGVPVVSMLGSSEPNCVGTNYTELVRMGVRALAGQGCRHIGLISALGLSNKGRAQSAAHRETLSGLGLPVHEDSIWQQMGTELYPAQGMREEHGYWALRKLLEAGPLDGVVIDDDMMTRGVLTAAKKLGLMVGSDLKIATHANKGSSTLSEQESALTLMEMDPNDFVEAMFGMLERLMAGSELSAKSVLISPKLRVPASSPISR